MTLRNIPRMTVRHCVRAVRPLLLASMTALPAALSALPTVALAAPADAITIPGEKIFPESITATSDGSVIIGSIGQKTIYRAKPGAATAEVWVAAGTDGLNNVLGVFADNKTNTLYA